MRTEVSNLKLLNRGSRCWTLSSRSLPEDQSSQVRTADLHTGSQSSGRPLVAPYWPLWQTRCFFAVSRRPGKDIWSPESGQQVAQCAPPAASSPPSVLRQFQVHVLLWTTLKITNISPLLDSPWYVECVVEAEEDDNDLAGTPATRSISTGHLLELLPSSDLAASFWHTLGTAVRKGQQRITESMWDTLDLKEQQGEEDNSVGQQFSTKEL